MAPRLGLIALVLLACGCDRGKTAEPICTARIATQEGAFEGKAAREGEEAEAQTKKRALAQACAAYCGKLGGTTLERCQPRCLVDVQAAKVGARITCAVAPVGSAP